MKSIIVLFFAAIVLLVSGQFFGWWTAPIPGIEMVPSYQERKTTRAEVRSDRRKVVGMDDENGEPISKKNTKRRSEALKTGGGVGAY